jgi:hypothetical protein
VTDGRLSSRAPRRMRLALGVLAALTTALLPRPSTAQPQRGAVLVLGLRAPDGDDEAAANATEALRRAARAAGFEVPASSPALEQSMAAFGCDDSLPAECLAQIASDLHAERMVYGAVRRQGHGRAAQLRIEAALYDHTAHSTSAHDQVSVPRSTAQAPNALDTPAQRLIESLLPTPAEPPPPTVASGTPPPPEEPLPPEEPPPAASRSLPVRRYIGYGAMGTGVVLAGIGLLAFGLPWLQFRDDVSNARPGDPFSNPPTRGQVWENYQPFSPNDPRTSDYGAICHAAVVDGRSNYNSSMPYPQLGMVKDICNRQNALLTGEWSFVIAGSVVFLAGLVLTMTDTAASTTQPARQPRTRRRRPEIQFGFAPVVAPGYQGGSLQLQL